MPQQLPCQTAAFFVLRSPSLPVGALLHQSQTRCEANSQEFSHGGLEGSREALRKVIRHLVRRVDFREALNLASPDLAFRLDAWLEGTLTGKTARNMEQSLVKYLSRMSNRSTPFGLFAGVSTGKWGGSSNLSVGSWAEGRKSVRLDWGILETLADQLEQAPEVHDSICYRPNSSLFARGGWYRYLERRKVPENAWTYHLEAVESSPHLDLILQGSTGGRRLMELTATLVDKMQVDPIQARAFLERVIDAQVLCGGLHPALSSPNPLNSLIESLLVNSSSATVAESLVSLKRQLDLLQENNIGTYPDGYRSLMNGLLDLGVPLDTRDLLQVDLFRPSPDLQLSNIVREALEEGAELLRRLTPPPAEGPLDRFRRAFVERYEGRWMPLLEALDEESGIGFDGEQPMDSALLDGIPFHKSAPPKHISHRDAYLIRTLPRWTNAMVWELSETDVEALSNPDTQPFPESFAALTCLSASSQAAMDCGEFQFWMEGYSGPTAARWLGRFASGDSQLKDALEAHLLKEEASRPEAVFAEVVHVPEGRIGNVLARPSLRAYEIPFLATPSVQDDRTLPPSDLVVTVRGDRIFVASMRLGREVIPRLSSAHNFMRGPAVYRFLAHLQDQDGRPGGWSWGVLSDQGYLPRVIRGCHVLSRARWRIEASELKEAMASSDEGAWGAFLDLRKGRGLPRFVLLTDADNTLLLDLDQILCVETLHHLVSSRAVFTLTECFPDPGQALVSSPEGRFAHELVIPFEATRSNGWKHAPLLQLTKTQETHSFPPGSEWLYLKVYCGPTSADRILVELAPLIEAAKTKGLWDRWHFVRYFDPNHHLRLRFHGKGGRLVSELLPMIRAHLDARLVDRLIWKWQVDTFEPEYERYGGALGFDLAEQWFFEDSQEVLKQLLGNHSEDERWKSGLQRVDEIWGDLGLSIQARRGLAAASRDGFRKEFGDSRNGAVEIGVRYRSLRKELEGHVFAPSGLDQRPFRPIISMIRSASRDGHLQEELLKIASSLAHMHLNRILRSNHREYEWMLMEFLYRLYESGLAREARAKQGAIAMN